MNFDGADELIGWALDDTLDFLNGGGEERAPHVCTCIATGPPRR